MRRFLERWLPGLVTSALQLLAGALLFKQQLQPWVEHLLGLPRNLLLRAVGYAVGVSLVLFGLLHARTVRAAFGRLYARGALLMRRRGDLIPRELTVQQETVATLSTKVIRAPGTPTDLTPATISPGTGSVVLTGYPPTVRTTNNSELMLQEFNRQQRITLQALAMNDPAIWRNWALLDLPRTALGTD